MEENFKNLLVVRFVSGDTYVFITGFKRISINKDVRCFEIVDLNDTIHYYPCENVLHVGFEDVRVAD